VGKVLGIAAAGHPETAAAAAEVLKAGGNAFDAVLAGLAAATVAEPLLTSLGGGGFLLAKPAGLSAELYDFFVSTPGRRRPDGEIDFYPIVADFGTATQEFHIGMGSIAVPGVIAGMFEVHARRCRMPLSEILAPAIALARGGVAVNDFQHRIASILAPIVAAAPEATRLLATDDAPDRMAGVGERVRNVALADALEVLAVEGPELFYRGEMGARLAADSEARGGMLTRSDLENYRVERRAPIEVDVRGGRLDSNSPPSPGGCLIALALSLVQGSARDFGAWGSPAHCRAVVGAIAAANRVRRQHHLERGFDERIAGEILGPESVEALLASLERPGASRGTTHISVADHEGNVASLTSSNGEGSAYVLPGTGIMLNNMLGEEDLSPLGFHQWAPGTRLASMMSPSVLTREDGGHIALGSGGSNRIRSALLQVLVNVLDFEMDLEQAVGAPRLHLEREHLSIEGGYPEASVAALTEAWPDHRLWERRSLFFGGTHAVARLADGRFQGAGDPRRGGAAALATA